MWLTLLGLKYKCDWLFKVYDKNILNDDSLDLEQVLVGTSVQ